MDYTGSSHRLWLFLLTTLRGQNLDHSHFTDEESKKTKLEIEFSNFPRHSVHRPHALWTLTCVKPVPWCSLTNFTSPSNTNSDQRRQRVSRLHKHQPIKCIQDGLKPCGYCCEGSTGPGITMTFTLKRTLTSSAWTSTFYLNQLKLRETKRLPKVIQQLKLANIWGLVFNKAAFLRSLHSGRQGCYRSQGKSHLKVTHNCLQMTHTDVDQPDGSGNRCSWDTMTEHHASERRGLMSWSHNLCFLVLQLDLLN